MPISRPIEHGAVQTRIAGDLRVEGRGEQLPLHGPGPERPACSARTSTPSPTRATRGARMNTARTGPTPSRRRRTRRSRPGGRRRCARTPMSMSRQQRLAAVHLGRHHDHARAGPEDRHDRRAPARGSARPGSNAPRQLRDRGRLPAGDREAVDGRELLGRADPHGRRARLARTSPRARGSRPAGRGLRPSPALRAVDPLRTATSRGLEQLLADLPDLQAGHRLAECRGRPWPGCRGR